MDFSAIKTVAVLPFQNLTGDENSANRATSTFQSMLLEGEAVYALPPGEVFRGVNKIGGNVQTGLSVSQIKQLKGVLDVDAIFVGTLREYGTIRSGSASANVISLNMQLIETSEGQIVWSGSATRGGITIWDRLFGGGTEPMSGVTEAVVDDLLDKLF